MENISAQNALAMFRLYEKKASLEGIKFIIPENSFNGPSYLDFFYNEETEEAEDLKVFINRDYICHRYINLSMCHELGHVRNIKRKIGYKFIDPKTIPQWIIAEVSADREAFKIYGKPRKIDTLRWLAEKIWLTMRNMRKKEYKAFIRKQFVVGIARFLAAAVA